MEAGRFLPAVVASGRSTPGRYAANGVTCENNTVGPQCILTTMPTVLRVGPYRLFFYSADRGESAHVHIEREAKHAKFWLDPVRLYESRGFNRVEIKRLRGLVERNESRLLEAWHEFFSK